MIEPAPDNRTGNRQIVRDIGGRFGKGNRSGGRPRKEVEDQYLQALRTSISIQDFKKIVTRAVKDAKGGDKSARDWISKYCIDLNVEERLIALEEALAESVSHRNPYGF